MNKRKEVLRIILLTTVILILLIVALYEYIPNGQAVTEVTTYEQTGKTVNVIKEISDTTSSGFTNESIIKSYKVTEGDLNNYEKNYKYDSGRGNPFENIVYNPLTMSDTTGSSTGKGNTTTNSTNKATGYFNSTGKNK